MDITPGEFESFRSHSSRTRRSDTRSSMRSDTTGSLEILPPEEDKETLFMSEELSDEDESFILDEYLTKQQSIGEGKDSKPIFQNQSSPTSTSSSSPYQPIIDEDPEIQKLIKKMKKYDKMLRLTMKKEKEVKLQRLLFQKQMLEELNAVEGKNEDKLTNNEHKFLSLMPPPDRLQEMMMEIQKDELTPIFQTETNLEESSVPSVHSISPRPQDKPGSNSTENVADVKSESMKSGVKKKIDFIKRNIELAKDAGNYMTDDEKARLNLLLSDLDEITDGSNLDVKEAFGQLSLVGQGYTPNEEDGKRLAEIDEKIQSLIPEDEFFMVCGTPHLSARGTDAHFDAFGKRPECEPVKSHTVINVNIEDVQKRLEVLDDEWKRTFDGTTPRLTDEQLQRLLDECSLPRSSVNSSLSLRTLMESQASFTEVRHSSMSNTNSHFDMSSDLTYNDDDGHSESNFSVAVKLPTDTLERLLTEARTSLGLHPARDSEDVQSEEDTENVLSPAFHRVENTGKISSEDLVANTNMADEMSLEEV